jgi:hypothetical protein
MAAAMRNAAKAWRENIKKAHEAGQISDAEYSKYKARWERAEKIGNAKKYRAHIAQARLANFKAKFPTAAYAVAFFDNPINRNTQSKKRKCSQYQNTNHLQDHSLNNLQLPLQQLQNRLHRRLQKQLQQAQLQPYQSKQKNKIILDKDIGFIIKLIFYKNRP